MDLLPKVFNKEGLTETAGLGRGFYRHHDEFPKWSPRPDPQEILNEAIVYASHNTQHEAVAFLLDQSAEASAAPYYSSVLHWSAYGSRPDLAEMLQVVDHDTGEQPASLFALIEEG